MSESKVWLSCVKWFNDAKGFGFIRHPEKPNVDVFVHYSEIQTEGFRTLEEDQDVQFRMVKTPKGYLAQDVRPR